MELTRSALLGLTIGVVISACQACAWVPDDGRQEIEEPGCELRVSFGPETLEAGLHAIARINAATGCAVEASEEGVPVEVLSTMTTDDGEPACGGTLIARYKDGALHSIPKIQVATSVANCNSLEAILVHEIFHAMAATNDAHSASGVFHANSGNGELIDEATLETICSHIDCPAFVPEG